LHLVLVGLSHHQTPIAVRERLTCSEHRLPEALAGVVACPGVREAAILSTCNRMEVYALVESENSAEAYAALTGHLSAFHSVPESLFSPYLYRKSEQEVVAHLLRVASGLDSLVLGEAQILGQVRGALRVAQNRKALGSVLTALFQQALTAGKRVQQETGLGRGGFSIGHAAVDLASRIFSLQEATVLILGAGKMSELTAQHLVSNGVRFVVVANRTFEKAVRMAERLGGQATAYDQFPETMARADIVISSTAAPHPILRRETLQPILRKRRGKPLFLIDIAMPRDIDPDVADLENVFLYNMYDLEAVVADQARERAAEATRAEALVAEEMGRFLAWYRSREAAPVIHRLRERFDQIAQRRLEILRSRLGPVSEREWQTIEQHLRALMDDVVREPILRLKQAGVEANSEEIGVGQYDLLTAAVELFRLDPPALQEAASQNEAASESAEKTEVRP